MKNLALIITLLSVAHFSPITISAAAAEQPANAQVDRDNSFEASFERSDAPYTTTLNNAINEELNAEISVEKLSELGVAVIKLIDSFDKINDITAALLKKKGPCNKTILDKIFLATVCYTTHQGAMDSPGKFQPMIHDISKKKLIPITQLFSVLIGKGLDRQYMRRTLCNFATQLKTHPLYRNVLYPNLADLVFLGLLNWAAEEEPNSDTDLFINSYLKDAMTEFVFSKNKAPNFFATIKEILDNKILSAAWLEKNFKNYCTDNKKKLDSKVEKLLTTGLMDEVRAKTAHALNRGSRLAQAPEPQNRLGTAKARLQAKRDKKNNTPLQLPEEVRNDSNNLNGNKKLNVQQLKNEFKGLIKIKKPDDQSAQLLHDVTLKLLRSPAALDITEIIKHKKVSPEAKKIIFIANLISLITLNSFALPEALNRELYNAQTITESLSQKGLSNEEILTILQDFMSMAKTTQQYELALYKPLKKAIEQALADKKTVFNFLTMLLLYHINTRIFKSEDAFIRSYLIISFKQQFAESPLLANNPQIRSIFDAPFWRDIQQGTKKQKTQRFLPRTSRPWAGLPSLSSGYEDELAGLTQALGLNEKQPSEEELREQFKTIITSHANTNTLHKTSFQLMRRFSAYAFILDTIKKNVLSLAAQEAIAQSILFRITHDQDDALVTSYSPITRTDFLVIKKILETLFEQGLNKTNFHVALLSKALFFQKEGTRQNELAFIDLIFLGITSWLNETHPLSTEDYVAAPESDGIKKTEENLNDAKYYLNSLAHQFIFDDEQPRQLVKKLTALLSHNLFSKNYLYTEYANYCASLPMPPHQDIISLFEDEKGEDTDANPPSDTSSDSEAQGPELTRSPLANNSPNIIPSLLIGKMLTQAEHTQLFEQLLKSSHTLLPNEQSSHLRFHTICLLRHFNAYEYIAQSILQADVKNFNHIQEVFNGLCSYLISSELALNKTKLIKNLIKSFVEKGLAFSTCFSHLVAAFNTMPEVKNKTTALIFMGLFKWFNETKPHPTTSIIHATEGISIVLKECLFDTGELRLFQDIVKNDVFDAPTLWKEYLAYCMKELKEHDKAIIDFLTEKCTYGDGSPILAPDNAPHQASADVNPNAAVENNADEKELTSREPRYTAEHPLSKEELKQFFKILINNTSCLSESYFQNLKRTLFALLKHKHYEYVATTLKNCASPHQQLLQGICDSLSIYLIDEPAPLENFSQLKEIIKELNQKGLSLNEIGKCLSNVALQTSHSKKHLFDLVVSALFHWFESQLSAHDNAGHSRANQNLIEQALNTIIFSPQDVRLLKTVLKEQLFDASYLIAVYLKYCASHPRDEAIFKLLHRHEILQNEANNRIARNAKHIPKIQERTAAIEKKSAEENLRRLNNNKTTRARADEHYEALLESLNKQPDGGTHEGAPQPQAQKKQNKEKPKKQGAKKEVATAAPAPKTPQSNAQPALSKKEERELNRKKTQELQRQAEERKKAHQQSLRKKADAEAKAQADAQEIKKIAQNFTRVVINNATKQYLAALTAAELQQTTDDEKTPVAAPVDASVEEVITEIAALSMGDDGDEKNEITTLMPIEEQPNQFSLDNHAHTALILSIWKILSTHAKNNDDKQLNVLNTPFFEQEIDGEYNALKALLNAQDPETGDTLLHIAIKNWSLTFAENLLQNYRSYIDLTIPNNDRAQISDLLIQQLATKYPELKNPCAKNSKQRTIDKSTLFGVIRKNSDIQKTNKNLYKIIEILSTNSITLEAHDEPSLLELIYRFIR